MRAYWLVTGLALFPTALLCDDASAPSCVDALEQLATLQTQAPVYKGAAGEQRRFIEDSERPAEIARMKQMIAVSCSREPNARKTQEDEAQRLHLARSPECAVERDKLAAMQLKNSHEPRDFVDKQRDLVTRKCPTVDTSGRWLVQWDGRSVVLPDDE